MANFRTFNLAVEFYKKCTGLKLENPMKNQFERAVLSICLNLSEGNTRFSKKDRRRFFIMALGSLREVQTILLLSNNFDLQKEADILGAHLYKLCKYLG